MWRGYETNVVVCGVCCINRLQPLAAILADGLVDSKGVSSGLTAEHILEQFTREFWRALAIALMSTSEDNFWAIMKKSPHLVKK
jgi:ABC-type Fe3+ transport system permease subunit